MSKGARKNKAASIRAKLLNLSKKEKMEFNNVLVLYMQERVLYRISQSKYKENFILKGGLLLFGHNGFKGRPTMDMDLLGKNINNDFDNINKIFREILSMDIDDGLAFSIDTLTLENIIPDSKYNGVRVRVKCNLGVATNVLLIDIGFGDIIIPKPVEMDFPVLIDSEPIPCINIYTFESVIAEKFDAMLSRRASNSRMKDFYDIYDLLNKNTFDGRVLQEAIFETTQRRGTELEIGKVVFSNEFLFDEDMNIRWNSFIRRLRLPSLKFSEVMSDIITFLKPVYEVIIKEDDFFWQWDCENKEWVGYTVD